MKKTMTFIAAIAIFSFSFATSSVEGKPKLRADQIFFPVGKTGQKISLMELSQINVKDFQALTGNKMSTFDRIGFKTAQKHVREKINMDGTINVKKLEKFVKQRGGESGFHLGGFALGFLLGLIGVLIAYLIKDDFKQNRVKWSWIGCAISLVLNLILIFAVFNSIDDE